jgi:hypothetical protein
MKKAIAMIMAGITALSLVACGQTQEAPAEAPVEETVQEAAPEAGTEEVVGMENPWRDITEDEANSIYAKLFTAPEGATDVKWSIMDSAADPSGFPGPLVQMMFTLDGREFTARMQTTEEDNADISGMFYDWTVTDDATLHGWGGDNMPAKCSRYVGENEYADLCNWYDIEYGAAYTLSVTDKDLDGFDIQAIAEAIYNPENEPGNSIPDDDGITEHVSFDITGCETFTDIVDKLPAGCAYANAKMGDTDVLLTSEYAFDNNAGEGDPYYATIEADVYCYDATGSLAYAGFITSGGTAYPLAQVGDLVYVGANHFVKAYTFAAGGMVIDEEASVEYDSNGDATYFAHSDLRDVGADSEGKVQDDTLMNEMYGKMQAGEVIEFSVVK